MQRAVENIPFKDKNQKFWQTGLILSSGLGLVSMMVGGQISKYLGPETAIISILIGNFILWFIGLGIISMTGQRDHTIQSIKVNLGKISETVAAIVVVAAFLVWFALQIKIPTDSLALLLKKNDITGVNIELRLSAILGFACSLIGMGGIKMIKWVNISSFPILVLVLVIILLKSGVQVAFHDAWKISFGGTLLIILTWLPGTVNLSTFFRHSRSRADSFLGLTIMTIAHILLQIGSVVLNITDPEEIMLKSISENDVVLLVCTTVLVLVSFFCVNLLNIYWASIGWETFFKYKQESKGYAIIGLCGTVIYIFFQSAGSISLIESLGTTFIANLGVTLIVSYIISFIIQHRVRRLEKLTNSICWFSGCIAAMVALIIDSNSVEKSALISMCTCLLTFAIIIFVEEITWSIKHLPDQ